MNVTQIISDTNIGGGGKALLNYLGHCDRKNFPPSVILPENSALTPLLKDLDIPLLEIPAMADKSFDKSAYSPLSKGLAQFKPQLVHTHGSLIGRMVAKKHHCKILYTKHCAFPPTGWKASPLGKTLVNSLDKSLANGIIAVGHSAEENLVLSGISKKRIHTMYNGVTPLTPLSQMERLQLRESYGYQSEDYVIGILARIETYKGHDTLLDALPLLLAKGIPAKLLIVGEGSHQKTIEEKAKQLPENTVQFTGFLTDVEKPLSVMDVQVNASYESETSCLSLLEGMSLGLPACASDVGGNPHLIRHGQNGLIFPKQNPQALADALERLYKEPTFYSSLQQESKKIFQQEFTATQYAQQMEEVYRAIVAN